MEIQIGERLAQINLISKDGDKMTVEVDGKIYNVDVCMFGSGQCSILHEGTSYNPFIIHEPGSKHYSVSLNYSRYELDMLDSQAKYMRMHRKEHLEKEQNQITAPMPSKIVKIYVKEGDEVKEGCPLIVFEAMKMQNTVLAASNCRIESVCCEVGDSVMAEQKLITLHPITK